MNTQKRVREKKIICSKYNVELIVLPDNLSLKHLNPSDILGTKLNFIFHNIIKKRQPKYFAYLDQDFFYFKPFSVISILDEQGMYGDMIERSGEESPMNTNDVNNSSWALHPWLSFYKYDFIKDENMDWRTDTRFDTGGKNWENFIKHRNLDKKKYWLRNNIKMLYPWSSVSSSGPSPYQDQYFKINGKICYGQIQIYNDTFFHMLNSSVLDDPLHPKTAWCMGFLEHALHYHS